MNITPFTLAVIRTAAEALEESAKLLESQRVLGQDEANFPLTIQAQDNRRAARELLTILEETPEA